MYYTFVRHHWKPSDYMGMSYFEQMTVRAFIERECEDRKKLEEEIEEAADGK